MNTGQTTLRLMQLYHIDRFCAMVWANRIAHEYSPQLKKAALDYLQDSSETQNPIVLALSLADVRNIAQCDYMQGLELLSIYEHMPEEGKSLIFSYAARR